jgi:hypothetical protein
VKAVNLKSSASPDIVVSSTSISLIRLASSKRIPAKGCYNLVQGETQHRENCVMIKLH